MKQFFSNAPLLRQARETILGHSLLQEGDRVLVAVSGGLDSMTLLHVLHALGFQVEAAHFDHGTRSGQSAMDAEHVRQACVSMGIACHCGAEAVETEARLGARNFEAFARERRYAFLLDVARKRGCAVLATGHHLDDQVETLLMAALGLASGFGACGMEFSAFRDGITLVRPLLECSRRDIEAYAAHFGIAWREDQSNAEADYLRNRIRHELLPTIDGYGVHARRHLVRLAENARLDSQYLDRTAARILDACLDSDPEDSAMLLLDHRAFCDNDPALVRHGIKVLANRLGVRLDRDGILRMEYFLSHGKTGMKSDFCGGITLYRGRERVHILAPGVSVKGFQGEVILEVPGETHFGDHVLIARLIDARAEGLARPEAFCSQNRQCFDWDMLEKPLTLRLPEVGERIRLFGAGHRKKIRDILAEAGVPPHLRNKALVLAAAGECIWLVGRKRGAAAPVTGATAMALTLEYGPQSTMNIPH